MLSRPRKGKDERDFCLLICCCLIVFSPIQTCATFFVIYNYVILSRIMALTLFLIMHLY